MRANISNANHTKIKDARRIQKYLKYMLKCILGKPQLSSLPAKWQRGAPGSSSLDESMKSMKRCLPADL
jgi:hypothetical protein